MQRSSMAAGDRRRRRRLNMLEPGTLMLKWVGICVAAGFILRLFGRKVVSGILLTLAGGIFLLLAILLAIEAHQDRILNEMAAEEREED